MRVWVGGKQGSCFFCDRRGKVETGILCSNTVLGRERRQSLQRFFIQVQCKRQGVLLMLLHELVAAGVVSSPF